MGGPGGERVVMFDALCKHVLVPLLLRAGLAVIFIDQGLELVRPENDWGASWASKAWARQNLPLPEPLQGSVSQMAVAWGELAGGVALALGFLTRLAALGLAAVMAGGAYTVYLTYGPDLRNHGYEYNFAVLVLCAAVFLLGGGALAVDRVFRRRRWSRIGRG